MGHRCDGLAGRAAPESGPWVFGVEVGELLEEFAGFFRGVWWDGDFDDGEQVAAFAGFGISESFAAESESATAPGSRRNVEEEFAFAECGDIDFSAEDSF
ncbi:MAG: hypothetical protein RL215_696 [Planctomycetota bacterium]